jgi:hypothetical protein
VANRVPYLADFTGVGHDIGTKDYMSKLVKKSLDFLPEWVYYKNSS